MSDVRHVVEPFDTVDNLEGVEIVDLGDAVEETKQWSIAQWVQDAIYQLGWKG